MKKIIVVIATLYFGLASMAQAPSIYSVSVNDINGNAINLSSYQGTKILICIAPIKMSFIDSIKISEIDSLVKSYGNKVKVIGVLSKEDGFVDSNKAYIKNIYQSRGINIVLTEGMFTKKTSGISQSALMKWVTTQSLNARFDIDATGVGSKYLLDKNGKMLSVFPPEVSFISDFLSNKINLKI